MKGRESELDRQSTVDNLQVGIQDGRKASINSCSGELHFCMPGATLPCLLDTRVSIVV